MLQFAMGSLFSGVVGVIVALFSSLVFKLTKLYQHPSLETSLMFIFAYLPYLLAEALDLSGIMAILFCGIVMSHYTHFNLSPTTQMTAQQSFRTLAFMAETAIFAYMGLSLPTLHHRFHWGFICSAMALILVGRALNIFPLSFLINRQHKDSAVRLSHKEQFIMWFSGLRGAIAFSLVLNLQSHSLTALSQDTKSVLVTTTLVVVLLTVFLFGGGTAPLLELLLLERRDTPLIPVSKTNEMGAPLDMKHSKDDWDGGRAPSMGVAARRVAGFELFDKKWLIPIFRVDPHDRPSSENEEEVEGLLAGTGSSPGHKAGNKSPRAAHASAAAHKTPSAHPKDIGDDE
mmetsp:Transcript_8118/g.19194  ORF Transcript_8118/g.19194 Transcript_8118/m.19194 type:complete len:344 (-) Transcript_8118:132-1163(-)